MSQVIPSSKGRMGFINALPPDATNNVVFLYCFWWTYHHFLDCVFYLLRVLPSAGILHSYAEEEPFPFPAVWKKILDVSLKMSRKIMEEEKHMMGTFFKITVRSPTNFLNAKIKNISHLTAANIQYNAQQMGSCQIASKQRSSHTVPCLRALGFESIKVSKMDFNLHKQ